MRVVVTGATGNVGTSLIQALMDEADVVGIARRVPDASFPNTTWVSADVATDDLPGHFRGADAVVHLAWLIQPSRDPTATWQANVVGSIRVFEAAARAGVPTLVHASSVGAYSPASANQVVDEQWPTDGVPTAAYSREKAYLERVLDTFEVEHPDMRVVRLRPGFIFKKESASGQRRIGLGPFLPSRLVHPALIPIWPAVTGLRFQALHASDVAEAYRQTILRPVRGAFNVAAEPVVDMARLAEFLHARPVRVPPDVARSLLAAAWHLRLIPASPGMFDLAMNIPIMDTTRARSELGWSETRSSLDAIGELMEGIREKAGLATPPLAADTGGRWRARELASGVGGQDDVSLATPKATRETAEQR